MSGKHTTRGLIFDIALSSKRQEQEQAQASNVNVRANSRALPKEINRKFGTIWIKCHILLLEPVYYTEWQKKVPDQLLIYGIENLRRF